MNQFDQIYKKILFEDARKILYDFIKNLSQKIKQPIKTFSQDLKFEGYILERAPVQGFKTDFDIKLLTTATARNINNLMLAGWTFNTIYIIPIDQYAYGGFTSIMCSYYILGKDNRGEAIAYLRKETHSKGAGQTLIYWRGVKLKATEVLALGGNMKQVWLRLKKIHKLTPDEVTVDDIGSIV